MNKEPLFFHFTPTWTKAPAQGNLHKRVPCWKVIPPTFRRGEGQSPFEGSNIRCMVLRRVTSRDNNLLTEPWMKEWMNEWMHSEGDARVWCQKGFVRASYQHLWGAAVLKRVPSPLLTRWKHPKALPSMCWHLAKYPDWKVVLCSQKHTHLRQIYRKKGAEAQEALHSQDYSLYKGPRQPTAQARGASDIS